MLFSIAISLAIISSMLTMMYQRHYLLMSLLALEVMMLSIAFTSLFLSSSLSQLMSFIIIIMLTLIVCEASLALACLIILSRSKGSIMFSNLSINKL